MSFWICESNADGTRNAATETMLVPGPTRPEYGDRFAYSIQETAGRGVRQRVAKQPKEMKWIWEKYRDSVPRYTDLYWYLYGLQEHIRTERSLNPHVWIKEDVTYQLGRYNTDTHKIDPDWVRVLVTYVGRNDATEGGTAVYPQTEFRFVLDDSTLTNIR